MRRGYTEHLMRLGRFGNRQTKTPGPRRIIRLDIGELAVEGLLTHGEETSRIWLTDEGGGVYALHANATFGSMREAGVKPYPDIIVECLNELADAVCAVEPLVPQSVLETLDQITKRIEDYNGETR